jgi:hypothetical protein
MSVSFALGLWFRQLLLPEMGGHQIFWEVGSLLVWEWEGRQLIREAFWGSLLADFTEFSLSMSVPMYNAEVC